MAIAERSARVGRLRIVAAADDPAAIGMRSENALRPLDLVPPGMAPHAILCIRSMSDPLPGGIDVRSAHAPRATEWERVARGAISDALRRAVHVARRNDAAMATTIAAPDAAVIFADRAELLACAARDAVHGELAAWYWKNVLRDATPAAVVREWKREPLYVPAALELLATSGARDDVVAFVRLLAAQEALELVCAIFPSITTATLVPATSAPPWFELVPEAAHHSLSAEQRLLLGVALTLRRAPALARRAAFANASAAWIAAARSQELATPTREKARPAQQSNVSIAELHDEHDDPSPATQTVPSNTHPIVAETETFSIGTEATTATNTLSARHPEAQRRISKRASETSAIDAPSTATNFAGLFFFLNLLLIDDEHRELDPWQSLARHGIALEPELPKDNLWLVLTELIGDEPAIADTPLPSAAPRRAKRPPPHWINLEPLLRELLPVDDPASFLLRRFGRVALTPAHVDVFFSLAIHPIEIRRSGLDRNPGWIRAAGRHVAFHFD